MNFFERQAEHRKQSKRLVLLFILAVLAVVAAVDLLALVMFNGFGTSDEGSVIPGLVGFTLGTMAVIGGATMYRTASLRTGGAAVAKALGATPVPESTTDFQLRRLRNVVEEIAIASGVPVPQIYVLEGEEDAINALTAGYAPSDAAVVVTRGALDRLNRDELQGVIAHEYSHVLNGDMRLNIRLMGLIFGLLVVAVIGKKILIHGRFRGKEGAPVLVFALGLLAIGSVGLFFGRRIKAGVSRQREYLADASAVQFTRQTTGISGALKKVGGLPQGSRLGNADTEEVSHMLFCDGVGYGTMMATHPGVIERIKALEPSFKGQELNALAAKWAAHVPVGVDEDVALGLAGNGAAHLPRAQASLELSPPAVVAQVGAPQADDYRRAGLIADGIPEELQAAARDHEQVMPLLFGLVRASDTAVQGKQDFELKARMGAIVAVGAAGYADQTAALHPMLRMPLAALAFPVLRRRPPAELNRFVDAMYALLHADGRLDLFEYCLGRLLRLQVQEALDPAAVRITGKRKLAEAPVSAAAVKLLAVVAQAGHGDPANAQRAYLAGLARVYPRLNAPYAPPAVATEALEEAWPVLDGLDPVGKELLVEGIVAAIGSDAQVSVAEAELLRVVCASLHCPLPPMLEAPASRLS